MLIYPSAHCSSSTSTDYLQADTQAILAKLERYIQDIETCFQQANWSQTVFAHMDVALMPELVAMLNDKNPGLNLIHLNSTEPLTAEAERFIHSTSQPATQRFIVNVDEYGCHYATIDMRRLEDGSVSALLFEPYGENLNIPALLYMRTHYALRERKTLNIPLGYINLNIQKSRSECTIFSLVIAKQLLKAEKEITKLHENNRGADLSSMSNEAHDAQLPATLFKHTQDVNRLARYIERNPVAAQQPVDKKGNDLTVWLARRYQEDKVKTRSIYDKRLKMYRALALYLRAERGSPPR